MFLREPQHVTAIGSVTDYDAHNNTLFSVSLILNSVHPPSRLLQRCCPPAPAEFRSVDVVLWVARFPREDAIHYSCTNLVHTYDLPYINRTCLYEYAYQVQLLILMWDGSLAAGRSLCQKGGVETPRWVVRGTAHWRVSIEDILRVPPRSQDGLEGL